MKTTNKLAIFLVGSLMLLAAFSPTIAIPSQAIHYESA